MSSRLNPFKTTKSQYFPVFVLVDPSLKEASERITSALSNLSHSLRVGFVLHYVPKGISRAELHEMTITVYNTDSLEDRLVLITHQLALSYLPEKAFEGHDFERRMLLYLREKKLIAETSFHSDQFCCKRELYPIWQEHPNKRTLIKKYEMATDDRTIKETVLEGKLVGIEFCKNDYLPITAFFAYAEKDQKILYVYGYEILVELFSLGALILPIEEGETVKDWAFRLYAYKQTYFCKNRETCGPEWLNEQADKEVEEMFRNCVSVDSSSSYLSDVNIEYIEGVIQYIQRYSTFSKEINRYIEELFFTVLVNEFQGDLMLEEIQRFLKGIDEPIKTLGEIKDLKKFIESVPKEIKKQVQFLSIRSPHLFLQTPLPPLIACNETFSFERKVMEVIRMLCGDESFSDEIFSLLSRKELVEESLAIEFMIEKYLSFTDKQTAVLLIKRKALGHQISMSSYEEILFSAEDDPHLFDLYQRVLCNLEIDLETRKFLLQLMRDSTEKEFRSHIRNAFFVLEENREGLAFLRELLQIPYIQKKIGPTLGRLGPLSQYIQNDYSPCLKDSLYFLYVYCPEVFDSLQELNVILVLPAQSRKLRKQVSFVDHLPLVGDENRLKRATSFVQRANSPLNLDLLLREDPVETEGILLKSVHDPIQWESKNRNLYISEKFFPKKDGDDFEYKVVQLLYGLYLATHLEDENAVIFAKNLLIPLVDQGILTNKATGYLNWVGKNREGEMVEYEIG